MAHENLHHIFISILYEMMKQFFFFIVIHLYYYYVI